MGWLQSRHGFVRQGGEAGARHRVKAHVINRRLNVKYSVTIDRERCAGPGVGRIEGIRYLVNAGSLRPCPRVIL